jgi:glycosyltransferase involved in cell wall biosynthesis
VEQRALGARGQLLGYRRDVPALMKAVDIVVHASIEPEPFGRVVVEGMFAERPVVAARGGGVAEIIADGVDGLLTAPNDPEALAMALRSLLCDPIRARALAVAGREKAERLFSVGEMHRRISVELQTLVAKSA